MKAAHPCGIGLSGARFFIQPAIDEACILEATNERAASEALSLASRNGDLGRTDPDFANLWYRAKTLEHSEAEIHETPVHGGL